MTPTTTPTQTQLFDAYAIGDGDFSNVACLDCARAWADDHGLTWNNANEDGYTDTEGNAYAHLIHNSEGEADSPYSCCNTYLYTNFTREGEEYLKENFPAWLVALYGY